MQRCSRPVLFYKQVQWFILKSAGGFEASKVNSDGSDRSMRFIVVLKKEMKKARFCRVGETTQPRFIRRPFFSALYNSKHTNGALTQWFFPPVVDTRESCCDLVDIANMMNSVFSLRPCTNRNPSMAL